MKSLDLYRSKIIVVGNSYYFIKNNWWILFNRRQLL